MDPRVKAKEQDGWKALNNEDFEHAVLAFQEVFALDPDNVAAYQGTVAALRKQFKFVDAEQLLTKALGRHDKHPGLLSERAWLCLARRQYDEAIEAFNVRLGVDPKEEGLFLWMITLLSGRGRFVEAEQRVLQAENHFPGSLLVREEYGWMRFSQKKYDQALAAFDGVLAQAPQNDSSLQGRVAALRMKGCIKEAARKADSALALCPQSPGLFSERAWLNWERGELTAAQEDFEQAIRLAPKDPYSQLNLASLLIRKGQGDDFDKAEQHCREALALNPKMAEAFGCLGVAAFRQGRLRESEASLVQSISLDPEKGFFADLAALYLHMGRYDEAKTRLEDALRASPANPHLRLQMGKLHLLNGDKKEALREFRGAVGVDPRNADAHKALAVALMESDELAEAERVLRAAIRRMDASQVWELRLVLCQLLARQGEDTGDEQYFNEALAEATAAVRLKPRQPAPHFHAAIVRFKLDDLAGALRGFRQCLSLDQDNVEAEVNAQRVRVLLRDKTQTRVGLVASYFLMGVFACLLAPNGFWGCNA